MHDSYEYGSCLMSSGIWEVKFQPYAKDIFISNFLDGSLHSIDINNKLYCFRVELPKYEIVILMDTTYNWLVLSDKDAYALFEYEYSKPFDLELTRNVINSFNRSNRNSYTKQQIKVELAK